MIDLDPQYQLAAVSEPKRKHVWVLSGTLKVDAEAYLLLLKRLETNGFDLARLERSPQGGWRRPDTTLIPFSCRLEMCPDGSTAYRSRRVGGLRVGTNPK